MAQRPSQLGIDLQVEIGIGIIHQLIHLELVKSQEPIGLVEPMLTHQGRGLQGGQTVVIAIHGDEAGVIDPLHGGTLVERRGEAQDGLIRIGRSPHDHLGALTRRGEARGIPKLLPLLGTAQDTLLDIAHRGENALETLVRSQGAQTLLIGNLDVDAQTVGIATRLINQLLAASRDALHVDVAIEAVHGAQVFDHPHQPLHRVIGIAHHARAEEKPLDVVATIELDGQFHQLTDGEGSPRQVVAAAVNAIGTVVDAIVGQHDLQKRDATTIRREAVADAPTRRAADRPRLMLAGRAARRTRDIILGRLSQDLQFL